MKYRELGLNMCFGCKNEGGRTQPGSLANSELADISEAYVKECVKTVSSVQSDIVLSSLLASVLMRDSDSRKRFKQHDFLWMTPSCTSPKVSHNASSRGAIIPCRKDLVRSYYLGQDQEVPVQQRESGTVGRSQYGRWLNVQYAASL